MKTHRDQMNVVIVGHVDHGKSTLIGRLLADTGSLPEGKLEAVKLKCERTAKPFEYAFLLDALKDEQSQGITIDTARCFFKSKSREYIIIDAPGHIEFLKNMVSGASRAQAALLVIDAKEGIRENSKRHGYMMSFLGIKNIAVCVNKMDLVNYSEEVFKKIKEDFSAFLKEINLEAMYTIPMSSREGDNIVSLSPNMAWYKEAFVLEALDSFQKAKSKNELPLRFPIQDIYKFTAEDDERRIFAGRVESGAFQAGDEVIFYPSNKKSRIQSIEIFNAPVPSEVFAGQSTGVSLDTQIYIRPGEVMSKAGERPPHVSSKIKVNIFWMGKQPLIQGKTYKLKLTTQQVPVVLSEILGVLDASELSSVQNKKQVDRHDVAECVLETLKPIAFDEVTQIPELGRFVIVDDYEIAGGGIILAPVFEEENYLNKHIKSREFRWLRSEITPDKRAVKYEHKSALIVITGQAQIGKKEIAKALEEKLFELGKFTYFLGISNELLNPQADVSDKTLGKLQHIQQLGEMAHVFTDAGFILITSISNLDEYELNMLRTLNRPNKTLVVCMGENEFSDSQSDLVLPKEDKKEVAVAKIIDLLVRSVVLDPEYFI